MGELRQLPNIGKEVERQLNEVGIFTIEQLKSLGAICGVKKTLLSGERKIELKEFYNWRKNRLENRNEGTERITVKFYEQAADELLKFAVIIAKFQRKWVICKHKERDTYEVPGGHREENETILETARRELKEETGAIDFEITPVCVYSVLDTDKEAGMEESFGMLYYAQINSFEVELHCEIEKVILSKELPSVWTYPLIQPKLVEKAMEIIQRKDELL